MKLYDRRATLTIGTTQVKFTGSEGLDLSFTVEKSLGAKPNTAEIEVFNLTPEHRAAAIDQAKKKEMRVRLEAGYEEGVSCIWDGNIRYCFARRTGPDVVLHLESGDSETKVQNARINKAWAPGTPVWTVIQEVADALGVGKGNLLEKVQGCLLQGYGSIFTGGTVASGSAWRELKRLTKSCGFEWSIQDGVLQVLSTGQALDAEAVLLSPVTGLVEAPALDVQKGKTRLRVKTLMIPNVYPGRKLRVEAESAAGNYRVERAKYAGDTAGQEWYIECECKGL